MRRGLGCGQLINNHTLVLPPPPRGEDINHLYNTQFMTQDEIYQGLKLKKRHDVVPDVELRLKSEIAFEINTLKKERNAVNLWA